MNWYDYILETGAHYNRILTHDVFLFFDMWNELRLPDGGYIFTYSEYKAGESLRFLKKYVGDGVTREHILGDKIFGQYSIVSIFFSFKDEILQEFAREYTTKKMTGYETGFYLSKLIMGDTTTIAHAEKKIMGLYNDSINT